MVSVCFKSIEFPSFVMLISIWKVKVKTTASEWVSERALTTHDAGDGTRNHSKNISRLDEDDRSVESQNTKFNWNPPRQIMKIMFWLRCRFAVAPKQSTRLPPMVDAQKPWFSKNTAVSNRCRSLDRSHALPLIWFKRTRLARDVKRRRLAPDRADALFSWIIDRRWMDGWIDGCKYATRCFIELEKNKLKYRISIWIDCMIDNWWAIKNRTSDSDCSKTAQVHDLLISWWKFT